MSINNSITLHSGINCINIEKYLLVAIAMTQA